MLINHFANATTRLSIGWKTNKVVSTCFRRLLLRSPIVFKGVKECRRLITGTSGVLSTLSARSLTSNHTSSVSRHMLTNESIRLQTFRYLNVKQSPITYVSRSVVHEDIQMYKMVHGGVYLSLTEEAGEMAVRKYCSETQMPHLVAAVPFLTRIEKTLFLGSAKLGDVLEAEAEIIYTAPHLLRVLVCLYAAPIVQCKARKSICRSWVWYELLNGDNNTEVLPVPPLELKDASLEEEGKLQHEAFLAERQIHQNVKTTSKIESSGLDNVSSTHILDNSFSVWKSLSRASPVLKEMDELAGLAAHRYVRVMCVTGSCDSFNIYLKLVPGCYVTVSTAIVFTSSKTVDVQCFADVETIRDGRTIKERAAEAFFTFVCLVSPNQPTTIRQFTPQTEIEKETYERRLNVYQKRKQKSKSNNSD